MVLSGELDEQGAGRQRHRRHGGLSRIRVSLGAVGSGAQSRGLAMSSDRALRVFDPLGSEWFLMISLTPKRGRVTLSPLRQRGTRGPRRGETEYRHFPLPSGAKARPGTEVAGGRTGWAEQRQVGAGSTPTSCSPFAPTPISLLQLPDNLLGQLSRNSLFRANKTFVTCPGQPGWSLAEGRG